MDNRGNKWTGTLHTRKLIDVSTIVFLHAHPDDESTNTSGTMAEAVSRGDRVVVVYATWGCAGSAPEGGESIRDCRVREAGDAASVIGLHRVEWLGYCDSGMTGWDQNHDERSFWQATVDEAGARLASILDEEDADWLVGYDWHGGYGHPDHVKVHRVAHRAAELAARRPRVLEHTVNRDQVRRTLLESGQPAEEIEPFMPDNPMDDGNPMGTPEADIAHRVDVRHHLATKRSALECHASQPDARFFLGFDDELFAASFGFEHYIEPGAAPGMRVGWPFAAAPSRSEEPDAGAA